MVSLRGGNFRWWVAGRLWDFDILLRYRLPREVKVLQREHVCSGGNQVAGRDGDGICEKGCDCIASSLERPTNSLT